MKNTYSDPYDCNFADPLPFDYSLLNFLYVHKDGNIELDFAGDEEFRRKMNAELIATPRMADSSAVDDAIANNAHLSQSFVNYVKSSQMSTAHGMHNASFMTQEDGSRLNNSIAIGAVRRNISRLVGAADSTGHLWLVTQTDESQPPYAHMFHTTRALFRYIEVNDLQLPCSQHRSAHAAAGISTAMRCDHEPSTAVPEIDSCSTYDTNTSKDEGLYSSEAQHPRAPLTKWIDIQTDPHDAASSAHVRDVLSKFPLRQSTIDRCVCMGMQDSIDTDNLSNDYDSYIFINLMCTPLEDFVNAKDKETAPCRTKKSRSGTRKTRNEPTNMHTDLQSKAKVPFGNNAVANEAAGTKANPFSLSGGEANTESNNVRRNPSTQVRSVMQMRFDAARARMPRSTVPDLVPVCVIIFSGWVITIHEKPFAELRNLFNVIKFHCSPEGASSAWRRRCFLPMPSAFTNVKNRFTSSFLFVCLFQIAVGHHVDNVTLARASDELGDIALNVDVYDKKAKHDDVLHYITALRRCFGECGADINRRGSIIAQLLQPHVAHNLLLNDTITRRLLKNAQEHLHYVKQELDDCRDSVALSSWSHNTAVNWLMLQQNYRALRILVLLSEMTNIMCPVTIVHSIYSMNIMIPYTPDAIVPCDTLTPFWIIAAIVLFLVGCCMPSLINLLYIRNKKTKLIA